MTATRNIEHWAGNSILPEVQLDPGVDLTGVSLIRWWLGKNNKAVGTDVFVKKSSNPSDGVTFTQSGGVWSIFIQLVPDDTSDISAGSYYHECEAIDGQDRVTTLFTGRFKLNSVLIPADYVP